MAACTRSWCATASSRTTTRRPRTGRWCRTPAAARRPVIATETPGSVWFNQVSLFPPTYQERPNGNRVDLMQKLVDMKPGFLRFPGGNYLEGDTVATRFKWKETIGPIDQRPG